MCEYMYVCECACACVCARVPKGGSGRCWVPGATVTGSCELQDAGPRKQTWV